MRILLKLSPILIMLVAAVLAACSPTTQVDVSETPAPVKDSTQAEDTSPAKEPTPADETTTDDDSTSEDTSPGVETDELTMYIGPVLVDCEGEGPQKCLLVKMDPDEDYGLFYSGIEGFEFEPGYEYELRVQTESVDDPPAGGSSIKWSLIEVVDKRVSLEGNLWGLKSYINAEGEMVDALPNSATTAEFLDGQLNGSAGCNGYFGPYEANVDSLTIDMLAMTEMFCAAPPGIMEQENQYLANLQNSATYEIEGDQLSIANAEAETILIYELVQPVALEGTLWVMQGYNNGKGGFTSTLAGTEITAEFIEGTVSGSAGCNNYNASYEISGEYISVGPAATTRMFCGGPEGTMEQETLYLEALQSVSTYQIKADKLEIFDVDGTRMVSYNAAPKEGEIGATATDPVLANLEYNSEWTESGIAPLVDGEYREKPVPDAASETVIRLTDHVAYGQLADGREAAAVILVTQTGGSGTFYDLALVVEEDGQPVNAATTFLGDRVIIENLVFVGGEILVEMVTQGPDDPLCCPTQQVVQTHELQGDELVQTSSRVMGTVESDSDGG